MQVARTLFDIERSADSCPLIAQLAARGRDTLRVALSVTAKIAIASCCLLAPNLAEITLWKTLLAKRGRLTRIVALFRNLAVTWAKNPCSAARVPALEALKTQPAANGRLTVRLAEPTSEMLSVAESNLVARNKAVCAALKAFVAFRTLVCEMVPVLFPRPTQFAARSLVTATVAVCAARI
jgi:hypothetical protein